MIKLKILQQNKKIVKHLVLAVIFLLLGLRFFIPNMYTLLIAHQIGKSYSESTLDTTTSVNKNGTVNKDIFIIPFVSPFGSMTDIVTNSPRDTLTGLITETLTDTLWDTVTNAHADELYSTPPAKGEEFATLSIPVLDITLPIYEGTTEEDLKNGVGHYSNSVLPGEKDNSVLSGHRDTVFRNLDQLEKGDLLIVTTKEHTFTYKVKKIRIVDKDDKTVIVPKPRATLTLTTCYPFHYIGSAPKRYIIEAFFVS